MEHINLNVPDQTLAALFYRGGLGLTIDDSKYRACSNEELASVRQIWYANVNLALDVYRVTLTWSGNMNMEQPSDKSTINFAHHDLPRMFCRYNIGRQQFHIVKAPEVQVRH